MTRLAIVSGGATGIGRAIAAAFAADGVDVVIVGRRAELLAASAEEINETVGTPRVRAVSADLREVDGAASVAASVSAGRAVDILVNNAGGNVAPGPAADLQGVRESWMSNVEGNVLPAVLLTHAVLPLMARPGGRIVTVTSIAAFRGPATYGGAKAALHPWTAELAVQLAPEGITANVVAPGYVPGTEFYGERMNPEFHAGRAAQNPMNRGGEVEEIAATVVHLAGPHAGFLTGQIIQINGGALLGRG
ncbi:SDR family NAD(P)-dependent oxidoreductase [Allorhizocola rhizosphaerae]|uniref:SDR family NAD(P)-dependent oxidoreductase n=1 Tax=Allorhizocola rhizosphaerae TaxID=1872709 RepID=UPI000E3D3877|nr:SDR family oxidoreductase [Allorhizocola rhizosphaerae]